MELLSNAFSVALLIVGFGFVIFWHELGHFLAAKWVGIKVEQFAVGMGHALVSFRRGIGWKLGSTKAEYDKRVTAHLDQQHADAIQPREAIEYTDDQRSRAADELGLGETEYRLSWIPVGGYVKMMGQDDMRPGADAEDPRAFNKKSIPQRMLVVSAGVIMNIILAAILFMTLFIMGFHAPAPVVGTVQAGSPAQIAGMDSGDTILTFNDQPQQDFTKVQLNTALASADEPLHVRVRRVDNSVKDFDVLPIKGEGGSKAFLALGITPSPSLQGPKKRDWSDEPESPDVALPGLRSIRPGDVITHVNGVAVKPEQYYVLERAVQDSHGKPVELTVVREGGEQETVALTPRFAHPFGDGNNFNIAGMQPRMRVEYVASTSSPVFGKMKPGDVIKSIAVRNPNTPASQPGNVAPDVSVTGFIKSVGEAGQKDQSIEFVVIRDGKEIAPIRDVKATVPVAKDRKGVGVVPAFEDQTPVIAAVLPKSPADAVKDGLPIGSQITAVDGKPVQTWFDVRDLLQAAGGQHTLTLLPRDGGKPIERTINLSDNDAKAVASIRLQAPLHLGELITIRKTDSPVTAMGWGVLETRDLILQFYVTLQRMFGGTISASNLMGPVGIVNAGARFAFKGNDWLIWFLAMISANLAVVNFLPIPIVDGGLFLFLIIEKIQGKPLSRRAQEYAQLVGLALILSVFLMVTYNDIARMFGAH